METRILQGGCHCAANRYRLAWPADSMEVPARKCGCGFCSRMGGTWTSHPDARLTIEADSAHPLTSYRFGTATADFLFCSRCGIAIAVSCELDGRLHAVVNVNTLDERDKLELSHADSDFDGESVEQRLARRAQRWIRSVDIRPPSPLSHSPHQPNDP